MAMKSLTSIVSAILLSGCVASVNQGEGFTKYGFLSKTPVVCREEVEFFTPDVPLCANSGKTDLNYPSLPPIRTSTTIYTEGDDPAKLEENDVDGRIYATFVTQGADGRIDQSQIISRPVQIWPVPRTDRGSGYAPSGIVAYNERGQPLPNLQQYTKVAELEGITCELQGKRLSLRAEMYEHGERMITTYSSSGKVVAYSAMANVEGAEKRLLFVDALTNGKFNMFGEDNDLCDALRLSHLLAKQL